MCRKEKTTVLCEPAAVGSTRRWAVGQLRAVYSAMGELVDDIETVVSELVTNALNAGCQRLSVVLDAHRTYVRVAARDDAGGDPIMQAPTPDMAHGRGLVIVDAFSERWGVERDAEGKTVWAEFAVDSESQPMFSCSD